MATKSFGQTISAATETEWVLDGEATGRCRIHLHPRRTLAWTVIPNIHGKNPNIPAQSGIYAYAEVTRQFGMPIEIHWKYIGKSKNLRQRISNGHDVRNEANAELRRWMNRHPARAELWFAPVPESELNLVEAQLVRSAQPDFNIRLR